jgi:DNA-binding XRE family transcriptional regulator
MNRLDSRIFNKDDHAYEARTLNNVIKFIEQDATPQKIIPEGFISADELTQQLSKIIPNGETLLSDARKNLAVAFYRGEDSFTSLRLKAGLSQRELSRKVGTSQAHISKIEHGKNDPALTTLRKLSKALDVSIDKLSEAIHLQ